MTVLCSGACLVSVHAGIVEDHVYPKQVLEQLHLMRTEKLQDLQSCNLKAQNSCM